MPLILQPLYGGCSDFCDRCWTICGRAPRKKRKKSAKPAPSSLAVIKPVLSKPLQKPAHLKYVRYHPSAVVSPAWRGDTELVPLLRRPSFARLASAVDVGNVRALVPAGVNPNVGQVVAVSGRRKRKASD